jgi:hypothetical protein
VAGEKASQHEDVERYHRRHRPEERHYQQSAGMAVGAGFIAIFVLGQFY